MIESSTMSLDKPIKEWEYLGVAMSRGATGSFDADVTGDPCIVWDDEAGLYRMFYFALQRVKCGSCNAHAISASPDDVGSGDWTKMGPLKYTNPQDLVGGHTHKPWILMDPYRPNYPVQINGRYMLFSVSYSGESKVIQKSESHSLQGPWTVSPEPVIAPGEVDSYDGYHTDTVTAYWFEDRNEILLFYKGYPARPQERQLLSPWGSSLCAAVMKPGNKKAQKLGKLIAPSIVEGHWLSGWASGVQIFPAKQGGWFGLMTGSPTPPVSVSEEPRVREPAPSLGGWAFTPEVWPVKGWRTADEPIWYLQDIPEKALIDGMGENLWRHHMLVHRDGNKYLYCNSGIYGHERMFVRRASTKI